MLLPAIRFDLPFTCTNSQGVPTAPDVTPTATLLRNGTVQTTPVTVTMTASQGVASCSIPGDAAPGDRFWLRVSAVIAGTSYEVSGPSDSVESPQTLTTAYDAAKSAAPAGSAMTLTTSERTTLAGVIEAEFLNDLTGGTFLAGVQSQIQALLDSNTDIPVSTIAAAVAASVRINLASELARLDTAVSSRLAASSYVAPPSLASVATSASIDQVLNSLEAIPSGPEIAAEILVNPTGKLLTNAEGLVTTTNGGNTSGGTTFVMPLRSTSLERVHANRIDLFARECIPLSLSIHDDTQQPVDCTGLICTLRTAGDVEITGIAPLPRSLGGVPHQYIFTLPETITAQPGTYPFSLRVSDATHRVLACGNLVIADLP